MTNPNRNLYQQGMDWVPTAAEETETATAPRDHDWEKAMLGEESSQLDPSQLGYWPPVSGWILMSVDPLGLEGDQTVYSTDLEDQVIKSVDLDGIPHFFKLTYRKDSVG